MDIGKCEAQLQRQALFNLTLFLVVADGVITDSESDFMNNWLDTLEWNFDISKDDYYNSTITECYDALKKKTIEDFLIHRARQLFDQETKEQAMKLVRDIASLDDQFDNSEKEELEPLSE